MLAHSTVFANLYPSFEGGDRNIRLIYQPMNSRKSPPTAPGSAVISLNCIVILNPYLISSPSLLGSAGNFWCGSI